MNFKKPKKSEFWKNEKKIAGDIILNLCNKKHYQKALKALITRIWNATDIIFCHFRPFFNLLHHYWPQKLKFGKNVTKTWRYYLFIQVHHKSRSYDVWFMRYKVQRTKFIVILGNFLPSDPPNNPKNQNFEKILKNPGNIIILHLCTTNDDHMIRLRQMRHAVACTCLCTRLKH